MGDGKESLWATDFIELIVRLWMPIIAVLTVALALAGLYGYVSNGIWGTKFTPDDMWKGVVALTATSTVGFGAQLYKYNVDTNSTLSSQKSRLDNTNDSK